MTEWTETTVQINWREKRQPSQVAWVSETGLKYWGARDTSQGHQGSDRLKERGLERGGAGRTKDRKGPSSVTQVNTGTLSKATQRKLWRTKRRSWAFPSALRPSWTVLTWAEQWTHARTHTHTHTRTHTHTHTHSQVDWPLAFQSKPFESQIAANRLYLDARTLLKGYVSFDSNVVISRWQTQVAVDQSPLSTPTRAVTVATSAHS